MKITELTPDQIATLRSLKAHFPFRIVWGGINPLNGEFEAWAHYTKAVMNNRLRKGWAVFTANS